MIPVYQTIEGEKGDCFRACLASLFDFKIEQVPNFFDTSNETELWWKAVRDWLRPLGFGIMSLETKDKLYLSLFEGYFIVCGKTFKGLDHATIWKNGEMVHDPHYSGLGLDTIEYIDILYPLNPATFTIGVTSCINSL